MQENFSLASLSSMEVGGHCRYYIYVDNVKRLDSLFRWIDSENVNYIILGGGSNTIFLDDFFDGLVIHVGIVEKSIINSNKTDKVIEVGAGVDWNEFVQETVENNLWGLENLTLIPGYVGAVAVQNVGAYGQEVKNVIEYVNAFDTKTHNHVRLSNVDCKFSFRQSIFNTSEKNRYIITSIAFNLTYTHRPILSRLNIKEAGTPNEVRIEIEKMRTNGIILPKPGVEGNCGTFFRATEINFNQLPKIILMNLIKLNIILIFRILKCAKKQRRGNTFKLPSSLIIYDVFQEYPCFGSFTLYETNPAIVVNKKDKEPKIEDLVELINFVIDTVERKTSITIPIEPELIGFDKKRWL